MGFWKTFIQAYKFRRSKKKYYGTHVYYMGKARRVLNQNANTLELQGIKAPISKDYLHEKGCI